jgi:hypothetical protein
MLRLAASRLKRAALRLNAGSFLLAQIDDQGWNQLAVTPWGRDVLTGMVES